MPDKDALEKNLFAYNGIFADLWNCLVIRRKKHFIRPEDLTDAPTELVSVINGDPVTRYRDILKCHRSDAGFSIAFMGLENQTVSDDWMPVRVMGYDWMVYDKQIRHGAGKPKLMPVFTAVLYFGYNEPWKAPRALSEYFRFPKHLKRLFQDYAIRVIQLAWLTDEEIGMLSGDLKIIAQYLRYVREGRKDTYPDGVIEHAEAVLSLLSKISGDTAFDSLKEHYTQSEGVKMNEFFERIRDSYISQGKAQGIALGKEQGIALGKEQGIALGKEQGIALGKEQGIALGKEQGIALGKEQGIALGKEQGVKCGSFDRLIDMTKRIMTRMGKPLEDAMNYLQLDDCEKQQIRDAMQTA